ncbi:MAG: RsbRD N-terminal domain-containing protein [Deltaproteobacteria bacterium]
MKLEHLLSQKEADIVDRWVNLILETYPYDAQRFLKKQKDPFANPVGTTLRKEIQKLYGMLQGEIDPQELTPVLDGIIRIRAVQDFNPSQAVLFVFLLKKIVREELEKETQDHQLVDELQHFESKLDEVALLAFDVYMKCKEKLYEIRSLEARNQVSKLLKRAGLISVDPIRSSGRKENGDIESNS